MEEERRGLLSQGDERGGLLHPSFHCPSAATSPARPAEWSSSFTSDGATRGPREQVSSPYTGLALSRGATLPKITYPSSPLAPAAAYDFIARIGATNCCWLNRLSLPVHHTHSRAEDTLHTFPKAQPAADPAPAMHHPESPQTRRGCSIYTHSCPRTAAGIPTQPPRQQG